MDFVRTGRWPWKLTQLLFVVFTVTAATVASAGLGISVLTQEARAVAADSGPLTEEWNRTYGDSARFYAVASTDDGGQIGVGVTYATNYRGDILVVKTAANGNETWNRTIGGSDRDYALDVLQTADGGYLIVGSSDSIPELFGGGYSLDTQLLAVKLNRSGGVDWMDHYGGSGYDAGRAVVAFDGDYVMGGRTSSFGGSRTDAWLVRIDSTGAERWNRTYGGGYGDGLRGLITTADGNLTFAGYTRSYSARPGGISNPWLVTVAGDGARVSQVVLQDADKLSIANALIQTQDGDFVLAGIQQVEPPGYNAMESVWVARIGASGTPEWQRVYGPAIGSEFAFDLVETSGGSILTAGYRSNFTTGLSDTWLIQIGATGEEEWNASLGVPEDDAGYGLLTTDDGGYLLAGFADDASGTQLARLVKLGVDGSGPPTNQPPVAAFEFTPSNPVPGTTVIFNASSALDPDGTIESYAWDFGDGDTVTTGSPTIEHVFTADGTYEVTLNVTDDHGATAAVTNEIEVERPPVAWFTYEPVGPFAPTTGAPVTFNASNSSDPDGSITNYTWDFGDGDALTTASPTADHTFTTGGVYNVTLTVTDNAGLTNTTTRTLELLEMAPVDVKPDTAVNAINPGDRGVIPIVILNESGFDPGTVNVSSIRFGDHDDVTTGDGARPVHGGHYEDVDGDGDIDLVVHVETLAAGFEGDETAGYMVGGLDDGIRFVGSDEVHLVGR